MAVRKVAAKAGKMTSAKKTAKAGAVKKSAVKKSVADKNAENGKEMAAKVNSALADELGEELKTTLVEPTEKVIVIGHKNPDTDSICSAIGYANFKSQVTGKRYVPYRAGELNSETEYVLKRLGVEVPQYMENVATQLRDIEYRYTPGVAPSISLKKAWNILNDESLYTLPITEGKKLKGIITVGGIAHSYMESFDSDILAQAETPVKNVIETIDGKLIVGDAEAVITKGKVLIAAANPDLMEDYIKENDIVILGNRYESQLCAIEMSAGIIIVCEGAKISMTIKTLAKEKGCMIISTPYDTYTVARLMNQSMPIGHFMVREELIKFKTSDFVDYAREIMAQNRNRDFPIENHLGEYCGMVSRRNLLNMRRKKVILVDHNEKTQAVDGIEDAELLEIIDHHRLGTVTTLGPVYFRNEPLGCTATIILKMYKENCIVPDKTTAGLLCAAILSDTLMFRSPTCTPLDEASAKELAEIAGINILEFAEAMFTAGSNLGNKSQEEIFYQDFKKYSSENLNFGVGQISSLNKIELKEIKKKILPYMQKKLKERELDMIFYLLTDIINETSEVIFVGDNAAKLLKNAFGVEADEESAILKGIVSRKKQFIPSLVGQLQQ